MTYERQTNRQRKDAMEIRGTVPNVERRDPVEKLQARAREWNLKRLGRELRKLKTVFKKLNKVAEDWAASTGCDATECPETSAAILSTTLYIGVIASEFERRKVKLL